MMKKVIWILAVLALTTQSYAGVKTCSIEETAAEVSKSIEDGLKQINSGLDLKTLKIKRGAQQTFFGLPFFEHEVKVSDKKGNDFELVTFLQDKKTQEFRQKIGGVFVSDVIVMKGFKSPKYPDRCVAQYLSFTSTTVKGDTLYATRLVDQSGKILNESKDAGIFDRLYKVFNVEIDRP